MHAYASRQPSHPTLPLSARQIQLLANTNVESEQFHLSTIKQMATIPIYLTALNGSCFTVVLPDSGADISAAGTSLLTLLNGHIHQLIPLMSSLTHCKCIPLDTYASPLNSALGNAPAIYTSTQTSLGQCCYGKLPKPWEDYLSIIHLLLISNSVPPCSTI